MSTITNLVLNPSAETNLNHIDDVPTVGSSQSRVNDHATQGSWAVRCTADGAGNQGNTYFTATSLGFTGETRSFIASLDAAVASGSETCTIFLRVFYTDATQETSAPKSISVSTTPGRFVTNPIALNTAKIVNYMQLFCFRGAGTAFMLDTDGAMIHEGTEAVDYFDGDSPNAAWTGTPHASTSILTIPDTAPRTILTPGPRPITMLTPH